MKKKSFVFSLLIFGATAAFLACRTTATRSPAGANAIPDDARRDIDAGNQAWIDAMKIGDAKMIADSYTADGSDVTPTETITGRPALEAFFGARMKARGLASLAEVHSEGAMKPGEMIYEWGIARAEFKSGAPKVEGRYLTVWKRDTDGHWRIYRNVIVN